MRKYILITLIFLLIIPSVLAGTIDIINNEEVDCDYSKVNFRVSARTNYVKGEIICRNSDKYIKIRFWGKLDWIVVLDSVDDKGTFSFGRGNVKVVYWEKYKSPIRLERELLFYIVRDKEMITIRNPEDLDLLVHTRWEQSQDEM